MAGYRSLPIYGAFNEPFHISVKLANHISINKNDQDAMIVEATKDVIKFTVSRTDESNYKAICGDMKVDNLEGTIHCDGSLVISLTILLLAKRYGDILVSMETFHLKMHKLSASCTTTFLNSETRDKDIASDVVQKWKSEKSVVWFMINFLKALKAEDYININEDVAISVSPGINVEGQTKSKTPAMIIINPVEISQEWREIATAATRDMLTRYITENLFLFKNIGNKSSDHDGATNRDSDSDDDDKDINEFKNEDYDSDDDSDENDDNDESDYEPENKDIKNASIQQCYRLRYAKAMMSTYYCSGGNVLPWGIGGTFMTDIENNIVKLLFDIAKSTIGYQCYNVNFNALNSGSSKNKMKVSTGAFNGNLSTSKVLL
jgi:hypothetical protein